MFFMAELRSKWVLCMAACRVGPIVYLLPGPDLDVLVRVSAAFTFTFAFAFAFVLAKDLLFVCLLGSIEGLGVCGLG